MQIFSLDSLLFFSKAKGRLFW